MSRNLTRLLILVVIAEFALTFVGQPCQAEFLVNGLGLGAVKAKVWVGPNRPPFVENALNFDVGPGASASIPGTLGSFGGGPQGPAGFVPRPAGANPGTVAGGSIGLFWNHTPINVGLGGDTAGDGGEDLYPFVTPTSTLATMTFSSLGTIVNTTTVDFDITWSASDQGVAQRLQAYYYDADLTFPPDFDGEITSLPDFDVLGTLLYNTGVRVGPFSESFEFTVTIPSNITDPDPNRVLLFGEAIVSSVPVPEPSSMVMLSIGALALLPVACRRRATRAQPGAAADPARRGAFS